MKLLQLIPFWSIATLSLAWASATLAQSEDDPDPIIGTWELNLDKTNTDEWLPIPTANRTIKQTEVYEMLDSGLLDVTRTYVSADGTSRVNKHSYPISGGIVDFRENTTPERIQFRVAPGEWYVIRMNNGVQGNPIMHKIISADQQTMTVTATRRENGKRYKAIQVFDRQ